MRFYNSVKTHVVGGVGAILHGMVGGWSRMPMPVNGLSPGLSPILYLHKYIGGGALCPLN
jgi:hypothetical protein